LFGAVVQETRLKEIFGLLGHRIPFGQETYEVVKLLDSGGFGWVYEGINTGTQERVAIKVEPPTDENLRLGRGGTPFNKFRVPFGIGFVSPWPPLFNVWLDVGRFSVLNK